MNSTISWQQFKGFLLLNYLFAVVLVGTSCASATSTDTEVCQTSTASNCMTNNIKDTNYSIPTNAYFVSPDGKATNSGKTPSSPWTVKQALASAPNGATIVFRGGTYRNVNAKLNKQLILQAYPHEQPWLKGSVVVTGWVADGTVWRKDRWKYSFPSKEVKQAIDPKYPMGPYRDMVYVNGIPLKQVASKAKVKSGTFYVDAANARLYIGSNPTNKTVEATALDIGLYLWKDSAGSIIRGLGMAHYADMGIRVQGPRVTLENNTSVWNGWLGAYFGGPDAILRGNTISHNGSAGISGYKAHRMLLENNAISYNNVENFAKTWAAAGVKVISSKDLIWRNNIVEENFATGMWADASDVNTTIVNNIVRNNKSIGIELELSHKAIVAGNVVYKNGAGILIADSSQIRVYNNTLSMNQKNIVVKDSPRRNTNKKEVADGITWVTRNNVIKNNILSSGGGTTLLEAVDCATKQEAKLMITAADYNAYYRKSSNKPKSMINWSLGGSRCSITYTNHSAFKAAIGYEVNALIIDNAETNPFFVNEADGDYRLKSNSLAIGRGAALPADIASAIGINPEVPVDLGALQFKAVSSL